MQNTLDPADHEVVQTVFRALARSDWFDRTTSNESACAKLVIRQFGVEG